MIWKDEKTKTTENLLIYSEEQYIENIEIKAEDIKAAVEAIKIRKAGGVDDVIGEFKKSGGEALKDTT